MVATHGLLSLLSLPQTSHSGHDYKFGLCSTLFCVRGKETVTSLKFSVPKY